MLPNLNGEYNEEKLISLLRKIEHEIMRQSSFGLTENELCFNPHDPYQSALLNKGYIERCQSNTFVAHGGIRITNSGRTLLSSARN